MVDSSVSQLPLSSCIIHPPILNKLFCIGRLSILDFRWPYVYADWYPFGVYPLSIINASSHQQSYRLWSPVLDKVRISYDKKLLSHIYTKVLRAEINLSYKYISYTNLYSEMCMVYNPQSRLKFSMVPRTLSIHLNFSQIILTNLQTFYTISFFVFESCTVPIYTIVSLSSKEFEDEKLGDMYISPRILLL